MNRSPPFGVFDPLVDDGVREVESVGMQKKVNITLFSNKVVHVDEEGGGRAGGENPGGGGGVAMIYCTYKMLNTGYVAVSCSILF